MRQARRGNAARRARQTACLYDYENRTGQEGRAALIAQHRAAARGGETLTGRLEITGRGYGFVLVDGENHGKGDRRGRDVRVARDNLGSANHGDTVAVRLLDRGRGRREGVVTRILARARTRLCGIYVPSPAGGSGGFVEPDNERLPYRLAVGKNDALAREAGGLAVLADIVDYGDQGGLGRPPLGVIAEVLGDPLDARVQLRMAMLAADAPEAFSEDALAEAAGLVEIEAPEPGREDLRHLPHCTIDGEDARDFDDAICVAAEGNGFVLHVSIADVSHYVRPGSALDDEAWRRGTSIYLPGRVLPMLPERLSNDLCSLMPGRPRPAFTAILRFDGAGRRIGQRFTKSLIESRRRCTYTEVERLLAGDAGLAREYGELAPMLAGAGELAALLKKRRLARGGFDFDLPEAETVLEGGRVAAVRRAARGRAHMLIEDCMLAANEAAAETLAKAKRPVLYRVHEDPDPEKLELFMEAARSLGLATGRDADPDARRIAALLDRAAGRPAAYALHSLLLRAMAQARYQPENTGHYGLGAEAYLHFTSPIRRYPDLLAHRALHGLLAGERRDAALASGISWAEAGEHLSRCERRAIELERDAQARMAVLFLHDRVGETFAATVSGVSASGLYVELAESGISGFVPVAALPDDYYLFDSRRFRLVGERSGRLYQLGDPLAVTLEEARLTGKRLFFSAGEPARRCGEV